MFLPFWRKLNSSLVSSAVMLVCVLAITGLQEPRLNQLLNKSKNASVEELKKEIEAERVRINVIKNIPSLGFNNLIADSVILKFFQYFGDDARDRTGYELSPEYFDIIIERDPRFFEAYIFLSTSTTLYAGKPEKSIALMKKD